MSAPSPHPRRGGGHLRRGLASLALAGILAGSSALTATAQGVPAPPKRTVLITVDGTSIQDWMHAGTFTSLEAVSLVAARTHAPSKDPRTLRASAYATLGAGAAARMRPGADPTKAGDDVLAGALGEALARRGLLATAIGDASGIDGTDAPAALGAMRANGSLAAGPSERRSATAAPPSVARVDANAPAGRRTDYGAMRAAVQGMLSWASFVIVDLGDAARADRIYAADSVARQPWIARALADADAFASDVRAMLSADDVLMVASLVPPLERVHHGTYLAAVAIDGSRGLASSGTTRRAGVVSITDIAPTVATRAGVPVPAEMLGRSIRIDPAPNPRPAAARRDADFVRALRSRHPVTRAWLYVTAALALLSFLTIVAGRGRAARGARFPRTWRDLLVTGLLAGAAAPGAMLIAPMLPGRTVAAMAVWTAVFAGGAALLARIALGSERALLAIALADAGIVAGDLLAGTPLASRSPIGFQIAGGGRFYGIDEALLGVLLASGIVAAGVWLDRARAEPRIALLVAAAGLTFVAVMAGAPSFGSKFGAPFTLVPAFGSFLLLAQGRRVDRAGLIGIATATVLIAASLAAADALGSPESRSHIGRELVGGTAPGPLIARKVASLVRVTFTTVWFPFTVVVAGTVAALWARRPDLVARAFWGRPARRAALRALVVGSACALLSNDTGIMTVAAASAVAAACFYQPFLDPASRRSRRARADLVRAGPHEPAQRRGSTGAVES